MSPIPTRDTLRKFTDEIVNHELDPVIAAEAALRCGDADGACQLLLAEAAAGRPPDARLVSRVLPDLSDLDLFPVLVGSCGGDRVEMLLDVVEQDRMSSERDAVALFWPSNCSVEVRRHRACSRSFAPGCGVCWVLRRASSWP